MFTKSQRWTLNSITLGVFITFIGTVVYHHAYRGVPWFEGVAMLDLGLGFTIWYLVYRRYQKRQKDKVGNQRSRV